MRKIKVKLDSHHYEVNIGSGVLGDTGHQLKANGLTAKAVIITNPTVNRLYGDNLKQSLNENGFEVITLEVADGEEQKSLETAGRLYHELTEHYAERSTPILALGGGVIGDLAGFVAATYMRGVPLIQIPTTLLAQVDSSIGGKVAVNHGQLKNKIGAFYQPRLVITDIDTLKTLPPEELANGLAEVIKSAAIRDRDFFAYLERNIERVKALDGGVLEEVVFRSAGIKAEIVAKDERDLGIRGILNYGHTIGHALETASGFRMEHGEAIAIGMIAAGRISNQMGMLDQNELTRLKSIIEKAGLPTEMPELEVEGLTAAITHDKKVVGGRIRFVLLKSIGTAVITDEVSPSLIESALRG
jgi:3-dehydroquinate synthase